MIIHCFRVFDNIVLFYAGQPWYLKENAANQLAKDNPASGLTVDDFLNAPYWKVIRK